MGKQKPEKAHFAYLSTWEDAMRFGLMDGRPHSEISIKTYLYYANWFLGRYGEISLETLKKALLAIPTEHYAKRLKMYQSVTSLAKILIEEQVLEKSYLMEAKKFRPHRHLPEKKHSVDQKSLEKLLEACQNPLEKLIVILLSQTGLRVSEAASLKLEDLNFEEKVLTVRLAKWGKTRRVGLQPKVLESLQAYLEERGETESEIQGLPPITGTSLKLTIELVLDHCSKNMCFYFLLRYTPFSQHDYCKITTKLLLITSTYCCV